eukprot:scaffold4_cov396-Prasinococcus_capsulatus_cf.AAC.14
MRRRGRLGDAAWRSRARAACCFLWRWRVPCARTSGCSARRAARAHLAVQSLAGTPPVRGPRTLRKAREGVGS